MHVGGVEVQLHSFLTLALDGSDQFQAPAALFPGKETSTSLTRRQGGVLEKTSISTVIAVLCYVF